MCWIGSNLCSNKTGLIRYLPALMLELTTLPVWSATRFYLFWSSLFIEEMKTLTPLRGVSFSSTTSTINWDSLDTDTFTTWFNSSFFSNTLLNKYPSRLTSTILNLLQLIYIIYLFSFSSEITLPLLSKLLNLYSYYPSSSFSNSTFVIFTACKFKSSNSKQSPLTSTS